MFRKIGILAAAGVAGVLLVSWAGLGSYCSTAWHNIVQKAKGQVPLEFEIQRVRQQVADLIPDMRNQCHTVAEEVVAVRSLRSDLNDAQARLDHQKKDIMAMSKSLETDTQTVSFRGEDYDRDLLKQKLDHTFQGYKIAETELKTRQKMLLVREKALEDAKARLATIREQKAQLELQVAQLEAQLKELRLAQSQSKVAVDDSKLSECKASIQDLRNRLDVEMENVHLQDRLSDDSMQPSHNKSTADLQKEINTYFNGNTRTGNGAVAVK
jgi:chromosome segregation ATPase